MAMEFILLCHARELAKKSNTGQLLLAQPELATRQIIWARKAPDTELLTTIATGNCWLLYPLADRPGKSLQCLPESYQQNAINDQLAESLGENPTVILIDATWQQAQKMVNQSPYLTDVARLSLSREAPSLFRLRRNQRRGGLCTVECAIELLYLAGRATSARTLHAQFLAFMAQPRVRC